MPLNTILVIVNPTAETQPAFERGLDSAREIGAALHLYACATENTGFKDLEDAQASVQPVLDELAERAAAAGVTVKTELEFGSDWAKQTVAAAARCSASMVFNNSIDHKSVQRESRSTSDWTLMRLSPCPVLMIKNFQDWKHRRVLAAIKSESSEAAYTKLNNAVISLAQEMADGYGSEAHFVTAFHDLNHAPKAAALAQMCSVDEECIHLKRGKAADVICDTAAELEVDLIIVGTVARGGIKGRVIGNTCERLLDQTHSDVLILN